MQTISLKAECSFPKDKKVAFHTEINDLPADCSYIRTRIVVSGEESPTEDVYRVILKQDTEIKGVPVRTKLSKAERVIELDSCFFVNPAKPLEITVERMILDAADTFNGTTEISGIRVIPCPKLPAVKTVCQEPGYNSWPMIQNIGKRIVCIYSKGTAHSIGEWVRCALARYSDDNGETWSEDHPVVNSAKGGDVPIGKGHDKDGALFVWIRTFGDEVHHTLFRSEDGIHFEQWSLPALNPVPMQITDIFEVPGVGLMALWFASNYRDEANNAWGKIVSTDNGRTWKQTTVESGLKFNDFPTEPSAFYAGDGRIFVIARTEGKSETTELAQFQLESTDSGETWVRRRTNIGDVYGSTPSLIFNRKTGIIYNYYYHRGRGAMKCRKIQLDQVWEKPLNWPEPEILAEGGITPWDSGNVNALDLGKEHCLAYYAGNKKDTSVLTAFIKA